MIVSGYSLPREVVAAAHFYASKLMDGRLHRHVHVEIIFDSGIEWAGFCSSDDDAKPRYFTVWVNPTAGDILQTLAHELCHVKQYATGELDGYECNKMIWRGEVFDMTGPFKGELTDPNAPPWEKEAYQVEIELYKEFMETSPDYEIQPVRRTRLFWDQYRYCVSLKSDENLSESLYALFCYGDCVRIVSRHDLTTVYLSEYEDVVLLKIVYDDQFQFARRVDLEETLQTEC